MTSSTVLLRQIHPSFVQNGRPTSQAFRPTPKDEDKLSVYDGDMIEPESAWEHYTGTLGLQSAGVMGIAVEECSSVNLPAVPDPAPFREHCVIDFSGLARNEVKRRAEVLARLAMQRDWLFTPRPAQ